MADTPEDEVIVEEAPASEPEIVVEDETVQAAPQPETPVRSAEDPEQALLDLKKKLEDEQKARQRALQEAKELADREVKARSETLEANMALINTAIDTVKQNATVLKNNYALAASSGDWAQAAEIQEQMAQNAAKLMQLEQGKSNLEAAPKPTAQVVAPTNPVEQLASQLTPRSARWVREHPEYATDPRLYRKMIAAHNLVVDDHEPDSDGYFDAIERTLGISLPGERPLPPEENLSEASRPVARRAAPPPAPVNGGNTLSPQRPNVVRLTPEERDIASMMGMTPQEYAKHKLQLVKEGKIGQ